MPPEAVENRTRAAELKTVLEHQRWTFYEPMLNGLPSFSSDGQFNLGSFGLHVQSIPRHVPQAPLDKQNNVNHSAKCSRKVKATKAH